MGGAAATMTMSRGAADLLQRDRKMSLPLSSMEMHERRPKSIEHRNGDEDNAIQERSTREDSESDSIVQME